MKAFYLPILRIRILGNLGGVHMDVKSISVQNNYQLNLQMKEASNVVEAISSKLEDKQILKPTEVTSKVTKEELQKNVDHVNELLETNLTSVKFQVHEELDRLFVEVVDQVTKEVVREIPPKEFLDMISSMLEFVGLIVDKRV